MNSFAYIILLGYHSRGGSTDSRGGGGGGGGRPPPPPLPPKRNPDSSQPRPNCITSKTDGDRRDNQRREGIWVGFEAWQQLRHESMQ